MKWLSNRNAIRSKILLVLVLTLLSARSFALTTYVDAHLKQLSQDQISIYAYVLLGSVVSLLLVTLGLVISKAISKRRLQFQVAKFEDEIQNLPVGVLHLTLDGKVQFLNESAARLLGRPKDSLLGTPLKEHFSELHQDLFNTAMTEKEKKVLVLEARVSNLFLGVMLGDVLSNNGNPYMIVTLANQDTNNRKLHSLSVQAGRINDVLDEVGFYTAQIFASEQLWIPDHKFSNRLSINSNKENAKTNVPTTFDSFVELIHKNDLVNWNKAFDEATKHGSSSVFLRLAVRQKEQAVKEYISLEVHLNADQPSNNLASKFIQNDTVSGEDTYNVFTMLVRENIAYEQHVADIDSLKSQRDALSVASDCAAYVLDERGNFIWSNAKFNDLLNILSPDQKSLNFLELTPFPDEVMQLHMNPSYNSDSCERISFEISDGSILPSYYRLELYAYNEHSRLNNSSAKFLVGMIHNVTESTVLDKNYKQEKLRVLELNQDLMNEQTSLIDVGRQLDSVKQELSQQSLEYSEVKSNLLERNAQFLNASAALNLMQDNSPIAIAIIDDKDRIVKANKVMQERLKYTEKELIQGNLYKLFSEPADAGAAAKIKNTEGSLHDFHVLLRGNDGNLYPGEMTIKQIDPETGQSIVWIVDRADEQFQLDKFENIISHGVMPIALLEEQGFSKVNDKALKLFGVADENELLGEAPYSVAFNNNEDEANTLKEHIEDIKRSGKAKSLTWHHKFDGKERLLESTFVPLYKDNTFDSILCMWKDNTELERSADSLKDALAALGSSRNTISEQHQLIQGYESYVADLNKSAKVNEDKLQDLETKLEEASCQQNTIQAQCDAHIQALDDAHQELQDSFNQIKTLGDTNSGLQEQVSLAEKEIRTLTELRVALNEGLTESKTELEKVQHKLSLNQKSLDQISSEKPKLNEQIEKLQARISSLSQESDSKSEIIDTLTNNLDDLTQSHTLECENIKTLNEQLAEYQSRQKHADDKNTGLIQQVDSLVEKLEQKSNELDDLQNQITTLESEQQIENELNEKLAEKTAELASVHEQLAEYQERQKHAEDKNADLIQQVDSLVEKLEQKSNELGDVQNETSALESVRQSESDLSKKLEEKTTELASVHEQLAEYQERQKHAEDENTGLVQKVESLVKKLEQKSNELEDVQKQIDALESARQRESELSDKLAEKSAELASVNEQMQAQNKALQELNEKQKAATEKKALDEKRHNNNVLQLKTSKTNSSQSNGSKASKQKNQAKQVNAGSQQNVSSDSASGLNMSSNAISKPQWELDTSPLTQNNSQPQADVVKPDTFESRFTELHACELDEQPELWFDVKAYAKESSNSESTSVALKAMLIEFDENIEHVESSIADENLSQLKLHVRSLLELSYKVKSEPLNDLMSGIKNDSDSAQIDNVSIRWPAAKQGLHKTMRVILSHINEE